MLRVRDYAASPRFYDAVLETIGYRMLLDFGDRGGYGDRKPYFWIGASPESHPRTHIAFMRRTAPQWMRSMPVRWRWARKDDGAPGLRPHYRPNYYGAFIIDSDGHNIEAVCHMNRLA